MSHTVSEGCLCCEDEILRHMKASGGNYKIDHTHITDHTKSQEFGNIMGTSQGKAEDIGRTRLYCITRKKDQRSKLNSSMSSGTIWPQWSWSPDNKIDIKHWKPLSCSVALISVWHQILNTLEVLEVSAPHLINVCDCPPWPPTPQGRSWRYPCQVSKRLQQTSSVNVLTHPCHYMPAYSFRQNF